MNCLLAILELLTVPFFSHDAEQMSRYWHSQFFTRALYENEILREENVNEDVFVDDIENYLMNQN